MNPLHRIIITLSLILASALPSLADTPYMELVDKADKACAEGKWDEAARALQDAIKEEPDNPGNVLLLSNIGMVRYNLGLDSLAIETFNRALDIAPSSVTIIANRAKVYTAMGLEQEAFNDYSRIMLLDSTYVTARFNHGLIAMRHRMFDVAKEDFEYLKKHYPASDEALIGEAAMHSLTGEYKEAIPLYTEILRKIKEPEYYGARAYCYLVTGDLQAAAEDIARALELAPDDGELYLYRAALNKMHFRPDDARKDAEKAIKLGVDPARAREFINK
ncbi:lipopolysaccharide assembly protein LapB [uncultured Duncaniella sp.]|uniref:tetratricopeptide repeat protein n=1 Tax=uncultured Duncaniella sp. TaxID=2768039 RepID=UPI0025D9A7FF|nr:tetratricopeptide repeat protein [uncultured Duncaniella sp.]